MSKRNRTKMTKDVVPEGFTITLALVDALPVLFFCASMIVISRFFASPLFLIGALLCFFAGAAKVLWKVIVVLRKKNIWFLFLQMRILMPIGFALMVTALILGRSEIHFAAMAAALSRMPSCIFFLIGFLGMLLMIVFAVKLDSSDAKANWIEQLTNGIAQAAFFVGLLLLVINADNISEPQAFGGESMRVLCFGDSNTYGYDPRGYLGDRYDAGDRWTDLLAAETGWEVINLGLNGREIPRDSASLRLLTPYAPADVLLVMLGDNDLFQGADASEAAKRMEAFLNLLAPHFGNIVLISPPPMQRGAWVGSDELIAESVQLAQEYRTLAEKMGIAFIDTSDWGIELAYDGVHFTEEGHHTFAERLMDELRK